MLAADGNVPCTWPEKKATERPEQPTLLKEIAQMKFPPTLLKEIAQLTHFTVFIFFLG